MNLLGSNWDKPGVYFIINMVNYKFYIGSTKSFQKRNWSYRTDLVNGKCHNIILQRVYDKGSELMMVPVVLCDDYECVELNLIEILKPAYNLKVAVSGRYSYTHTDEARAKIGNANRGKVVTDQTRRLMSEVRSARGTSDIEREARRVSALKRWADPEQRAALIEAQKEGRAKAGPRKYPGRKLTDEHRAKLSEAAKRRWERVRASKRDSSEQIE